MRRELRDPNDPRMTKREKAGFVVVVSLALLAWWLPTRVERYVDGTIREPGAERRWAYELRREGIAEAAHRSLVVDLPQTSADGTNLTDLAGTRFYNASTATCSPRTLLGTVPAAAPDPAPGATATLPLTNHALTGFACATAFDTSANESGLSNTVAIPDMLPPTVSITAPVGGATVQGTVIVTANATDTVGVVGVQFLLDGVALGAEDTVAPYSVSWDTRAAANGSHSLTAIARDAAGNATTSATVTVTVANDMTGPVPPSGLRVQ